MCPALSVQRTDLLQEAMKISPYLCTDIVWALAFSGTDGLTRRAETLLRPIVYGQVPGNRDAVVLQSQVGGLVPLVVGAAQGHGGEQVEAYLAIRLGIFNWCRIFSWLQLVCIKTWDRSNVDGYQMLIFIFFFLHYLKMRLL